MNSIQQLFEERTVAELKLALDEVKWLDDCVARGIMKPEHAKGYLQIENNVIATKRYVLGLS
jgi:hypothetical protein